ncbi:hypothetical protein GIB67_019262 [Kingdonia uniflora]|uniref:TraB domain-containing protein n=1 Tax=Kingdonia uniflora TaxID=39325 RepID=A0A7J7N025_9MAGN|nr:hypothetical protein GIB67_019262 [Kingdonia uniflora]
METLISQIPFFNSRNLNFPKTLATKTPNAKLFIKPPPPEFDFRSEISTISRERIARLHPELIDLVDRGSLVLIEKISFGPVPIWRTDFVEPEEIWLIGTTHTSKESAIDVERVARAVRPDNIVVELCRGRQDLKWHVFRAGIMYMSNEGDSGPQLKSNMFALSGAGFFGAVGRSLDLGGQTALALRLLLAVFSSKISSDVNRPFGDEFRAAQKVSEEVGAQLVLGDRPIEITLERAWNSLNWNEKLNLVVSVLRGITSSSSDTSKSNLKYLAWSLKRSKAVSNCKKVVGVIGKGHMNGVIYALISDLGDLRFRDLVGKRSFSNSSNSWIDSLLKNLVRDTVIGVVLWLLFEQLKIGL